jgi:hypothetical protein
VEQLIAFAMDNFFIVAIVLGVIYSMFFRKSPVERKPNHMPDIGRGGSTRPGRAEERVPDYSQSSESVSPESYFSVSEGQVQQASSSEQPILASGRLSRVQAPSQQPPQPSQVRRGIGKSSLNSEDLSRAVMWAEILGPPRAKRPHRR